MQSPKKSLLLRTATSAFMALALGACGPVDSGTNDQGRPAMDVLNGNIYIENGETFGVSFRILSDTISNSVKEGEFSIGRDRGVFTIQEEGNGEFGINGKSESCHQEKDPLDGTREITVCNRKLSLGLHYSGTAVVGATPSDSDYLSWDLTQSQDAEGNTLVIGSVNSRHFDQMPIEILVEADGSIRGEIRIGPKTVIMNGMVPESVRGRVPALAEAMMLVVSALHVGT